MSGQQHLHVSHGPDPIHGTLISQILILLLLPLQCPLYVLDPISDILYRVKELMAGNQESGRDAERRDLAPERRRRRTGEEFVCDGEEVQEVLITREERSARTERRGKRDGRVIRGKRL